MTPWGVTILFIGIALICIFALSLTMAGIEAVLGRRFGKRK